MGVDRRTRGEVFATACPIAASEHEVSVSVPPHVHDFLEIAVLTRGVAEHQTASGTTLLRAGDLVVIRPGSWHAYHPTGDRLSFGVTNAYVGGELVHGQLAWLLDHPQLARLMLLGGALAAPLPDVRLRRVTGWLGQLAEEQTDADVTMKAALLSCVLVEVSRALTTANATESHSSLISSAVRQAMQLLADDLARSWTMTDLARRVGVSTSSLYRQFRSQLGTGPVDWLTRSRAERAATLLTQSDLSVAAIGRRVGWPDPSYASRRFSQVHGMPPTAYRAAHARAGS